MPLLIHFLPWPNGSSYVETQLEVVRHVVGADRLLQPPIVLVGGAGLSVIQ